MKIKHISVSRVGVWDQCQLQYKFKYHDEIKPTGPEPYYFLYGKIIHKTAEEFVKNKGKINIGKIAGDVLQGKILLEGNKISTPLPVEYKQKIFEHLRSVQQITDQLGYEGHLEYKFEYDLDPPHGKIATGFIDRLIKKGDNFYILDYKTTKKGIYRKNFKNISHDLQLNFYARVVQKNFGVPASNIEASLLYLEGYNVIGTKFTDDALVATEKTMLKKYNEIMNTPPDYAIGNYGNHCNRCDYKSICPYFRNFNVNTFSSP